MQKITIKEVSQYGVVRLFPVDYNATLFCKLTGKKTFDNSDVQTIKDLGYEVEIKRIP